MASIHPLKIVGIFGLGLLSMALLALLSSCGNTEILIASITQTAQAQAVEQARAAENLLVAQYRASQVAAQTQAVETAVAQMATEQAAQFTRIANDTATSIAIEIMRANIAGTQGAVTATAQWQQTQSALNVQGTQAVLNAQATAVVAAAERIQTTNSFMAWMNALAPILAVIVFAGIAGVVVYLVWRISRTRVLSADAQGAYPLVYDNGRLLNASRSFGPVVDPHKNNLPESEDLQGQIALTDTQVGAVRAMAAGGRGEQARRMAEKTAQPAAPGTGTALAQPYRIVPLERIGQALPEDVQQVIDGQWKEVVNERTQP